MDGYPWVVSTPPGSREPLSSLVEPGEERLRDVVDGDLPRLRTEGPPSCLLHPCSQVGLLSASPDDDFFSVITLGAKLIFGNNTIVPSPHRCYTFKELRDDKFCAERISELPSVSARLKVSHRNICKPSCGHRPTDSMPELDA